MFVELRESLSRYIGQTVTIFTESGGLSGSGFTGTLACIGDCTVKLITDIGAAPTCPVGSDCTCGMGPGIGYGLGYGGGGYGGGCGGGCGCGGGYGNGGYGNGNYGGFGNHASAFGPSFSWLGAIAEIPVDVTKHTLFVCFCSGAFQELEVYGDLFGGRNKCLSFIRCIKGCNMSKCYSLLLCYAMDNGMHVKILKT